MQDRDVFLIEEIIEYCDKIAQSLVKHPNGKEDFYNDADFQEACAFRMMQIGEMANGLSETLKEQNPEIPWHEIVAFRNVIVHDYGKVDIDKAWVTIVEDVPELRAFCAKLIGAE